MSSWRTNSENLPASESTTCWPVKLTRIYSLDRFFSSPSSSSQQIIATTVSNKLYHNSILVTLAKTKLSRQFSSNRRPLISTPAPLFSFVAFPLFLLDVGDELFLLQSSGRPAAISAFCNSIAFESWRYEWYYHVANTSMLVLLCVADLLHPSPSISRVAIFCHLLITHLIYFNLIYSIVFNWPISSWRHPSNTTTTHPSTDRPTTRAPAAPQSFTLRLMHSNLNRLHPRRRFRDPIPSKWCPARIL